MFRLHILLHVSCNIVCVPFRNFRTDNFEMLKKSLPMIEVDPLSSSISDMFLFLNFCLKICTI